jgi:hypothetical protein
MQMLGTLHSELTKPSLKRTPTSSTVVYYLTLVKSGIYAPLVEKGWNNLKIHFTRAHKTYRLIKNTAVGAGYNMANEETP